MPLRQAIRIEEGDAAVRVPLQPQLAPFIERRLTPGDAIDRYVLFVGSNEGRPIFRAVEFQRTRLD